jgi:hypothetical protein
VFVAYHSENNIVALEKDFNILILLTKRVFLWYRKLQGNPGMRGETLQYEAEEKA